MTWTFLGIFAIVLIILFILFVKNKGKDPNSNASLSADEEEALEEDYLSHASRENEHDGQNNI